MPCLNEAETLAICIQKAKTFLHTARINGEVIVADNGSSDGSQQIARQQGACLVHVDTKGYGSALLGGIQAARGQYIIMGDADDSYDFSALQPFLDQLRNGFDLVMGNRFKGGIKKGAMPWLHRYVGNPVLTFIGRLFFRSPVADFHCGLRGFRKQAIVDLALETSGMEFASEMVVKATLYDLRITEVATTLAPDGRTRPPHLRSWRDGWRHLRFLLIYSPRWLFLYPGLALMAVGFGALIWLLPQPRTLGGITFDIHTMLYSVIALLVGLQLVAFSLCTKLFAINNGLLPKDDRFLNIISKFTLERGLVIGTALAVVGLAGSLYAFFLWGSTSFGELEPRDMMRLTMPALTALATGVQIIFVSFFLNILNLKQRH